MHLSDTREGFRLTQLRDKQEPWDMWGPFLSERAWGTVREDYSANGTAWAFFPHDHARWRTYRWNEDGLCGICDKEQHLCFALALWNGRDPFLKERMFGVTGDEGNHGEDVKEYYFYLDSTPTHAYMRCLYKYPQAEFPYARLVEENRRRGKLDPEFELADTGIFNEGRYFDVQVEYAKASAEDLLIRISVSNRGPEDAPIDLLPTLWFRNTWSWGRDPQRPSITAKKGKGGVDAVTARHEEFGQYTLWGQDADEALFTENETNKARLSGIHVPGAYVKDAFHDYVVAGRREAVNPSCTGTKAAFRYHRTVKAGKTLTFNLRLSKLSDSASTFKPFADFETLFRLRREEADAYYGTLLPSSLSADEVRVARQAFAGMLWSKQFYHYVVAEWLEGDPSEPAPSSQREKGRNAKWRHLYSCDVISMPDKWEFPWFAAWDLAFHCIPFAYIDPAFAKQQILLMLRESHMHPNGQIPAYEWDFNDVNPPVLQLAARAVFEIERQRTGVADYDFIERVFQKMQLNFTWWVNRKDALDRNIFQGGFLGMDNIGAFDRGKLPPGYLLGQADGSSWMAAFAKSMFATALLLAERNPVYEDLASKYWEHFIYIANSVNSLHDPENNLWDETDGFFYDHLITSDRGLIPIRARTMVGFVPLFGATVAPASLFSRFPDFERRRQWFIKHHPELVASVAPLVTPGANDTVMLGLIRADQLRRMLAYMLDENEFLSPYGIRGISLFHKAHPLILNVGGEDFRLDYEPGESQTDLFGGNSNWRGPVWMPVNYLIVMALKQYHLYCGDAFKVECPTGSGVLMTLNEVAEEIGRRLARIFVCDEQGRRAVFGESALFNGDPHWRDLIPFHEYFHGDTGRGCGASHQTGWTGLITHVLMSRGEKPITLR